MSRFRFRRVLAGVLATSLATVLFPTASVAQSGSEIAILEEIVVTARKREENLMDVPISITAFTENDLRESNAFGLEDIAEQTTGVSFRSVQGTNEIVIRGLAQTDFNSLQANVGVFIDGIYLPNRSSIEFGNMDIAQLEVLKGPQSAMYGRNTFAGAINYITNSAKTGEFDASIEGKVGNEELLNFKGSVNIPVGDNFAIRLHAGTSEFDGTITNIRGSNVGGWDDRTTYGASALFEMGSVRVKAFYNKNEIAEDNVAINTLDFTSNNAGTRYDVPDGMGGFNTFWTIRGGNIGTFNEVNLDPRARGNAGEIELAYINVDVDLDFATLTANVSTQDAAYGSFFDTIGRPEAATEVFFGLWTRQFLANVVQDIGEQDSFEVRLTSNEGSSFDWLVGLSRYESGTGSIISTTTPLFADPDTLDTITAVRERLFTDIDAVYGSVAIPVSEKLNLNAELRYTQEDQRMTDEAEIFFFPLLSRPETSETTDFSYISGRVGLDYAYNEDGMIYGYIAQGVKSGGINFNAANPEFATFDEETNITYELGIKTSILDGRGSISAAVYYIDWRDLQTVSPPSITSGGGSIFNGEAGATSQGIEIDANIYLTDNFNIRAGATIIDATYDDGFEDFALLSRCPDPSTPNVVSACSIDVGGNQLANTSDFQYYLNASYSIPEIIGSYDGKLQATYAYEAGKVLSALNLADVSEYSLLNLRASISNGDTELALWVDNALDDDYFNRATAITDTGANAVCFNCGLSSTQRIKANGRTFGLEARHKF